MNPIGRPVNFVQDNHCGSVRNVLRDLHCRIRQAQGKPVRIVPLEVFDLVVDIRKSSPTFGQWVSEIFGRKQVSAVDAGRLRRALRSRRVPLQNYRWNAPSLSIAWPIQGERVLSFKDTCGAALETAEVFP